jgi:hypothetical protein
MGVEELVVEEADGFASEGGGLALASVGSDVSADSVLVGHEVSFCGLNRKGPHVCAALLLLHYYQYMGLVKTQRHISSILFGVE